MSTDDQTDPRGVQRNRPEHVDALASTVISVLRDRQAVSSEGLRQIVLDHLVRAILSHGAFVADGLLVELRGYRLSVDAIIDLYIPAAARVVGEQWVDDKISFADVTIGIMRLQSVMGEAVVSAVPADLVDGQDQLHTLVIVPNGEQHFLGSSVLACQLRRMGCDVTVSYDEDMGSLSARLVHNAPDLILITCARRETLESIAQTVQTIRNSMSDSPVIALGGAVRLEKDEIIRQTDVDIVTSVAEEAVAFCAKQAKSQSRI